MLDPCSDPNLKDTNLSLQILLSFISVYNVCFLLSRVLEIDVGRADQLNRIADSALYLDLSCFFHTLLVQQDEPRNLNNITWDSFGLLFFLQAAASMNTTLFASWLDAGFRGFIDASLFRYIRAVRLLLVPGLAIDLTKTSDAPRQWGSATLLSCIMVGGLFFLDRLSQEYMFHNEAPAIIFGASICSITYVYCRYCFVKLWSQFTTYIPQAAESDPTRQQLQQATSCTVEEQVQKFSALKMRAVVKVFGRLGDNEEVIKTIAHQFRLEVIPKDSTIQLGSKMLSKRIHILVKGCLRATTTSGKVEVVKAPFEFGGLFIDSKHESIYQTLVSMEPSEIYVLDDKTIKQLQTEHPELDTTIRHRRAEYVIRNRIDYVMKFFKQGLVYSAFLALGMCVGVVFLILLFQSNKTVSVE